MKAISSTKWGKQKETLTTTFKAITRPIVEYGSTIWGPIIDDSKTKKHLQALQTVQNSALRIATGCTRDTNQQHLHEETKVLPIEEHIKLHASQLRQKSQLPTHPLHSLNNLNRKSRHMIQTIFDNTTKFTVNYDNRLNNFTKETIEHNKKRIHTEIVRNYERSKQPNQVINDIAPEINKKEETLTREERRILAQLRTNKSPILFHYKHKIDPTNYPSPMCPKCKISIHDTTHLFECPYIYVPKNRTPICLWNDPEYVASLLRRWRTCGGLA